MFFPFLRLRMNRTSALITTAVAIATGLLPTGAGAQAGSELDGFLEYAREAAAEWEATGLAVAVVKDGALLFAEGFGVRTLGEPGAVDEHTRFSIGSTTKAMTVAAIGMLVDEGKLGLDDLVIDHLPWFRVGDPYVTSQITIRDLLTHRAGMGNTDYLWYERDTTIEEVVRGMALVEPAYSMRSSFIYQNIMYATAGLVVEAVSGVSWTEFIRTRIFGPLDMDESVPTLAETVGQPNVASPHYRIDGTTVVIENASVDPVAPAGSVWSSVTDMSKWLRMLLGEGVTEDGTRVLSEATIEEMFTPQTLVTPSQFYPTQQITNPNWMTYGLAWFQHDYRGHKIDYHTGSIDGMVAIAGLIRDLDLGVYVLGNRDHVEVRHALMYRVFDHFLEGEPRDWSAELKVLYDGIEAKGAAAIAEVREQRVQGTSPTFPLESYVGLYRHPLFGTVEISMDRGALRGDLGPGHPAVLEHWNYDTFEAVLDARWRGKGLITFTFGTDGQISGLRMDGADYVRSSGQVPEEGR
jgi:CubicO group peptidase (beta-lactamase class C family)